jgi:hypothetical protein
MRGNGEGGGPPIRKCLLAQALEGYKQRQSEGLACYCTVCCRWEIADVAVVAPAGRVS